MYQDMTFKCLCKHRLYVVMSQVILYGRFNFFFSVTFFQTSVVFVYSFFNCLNYGTGSETVKI